MSEGWLEYDVLLDVRQLECPLPLLKAKLALRELSPRQVLKLEATDAGSWKDIPSFIDLSPYRLLDRRQCDGIYHFWIQV